LSSEQSELKSLDCEKLGGRAITPRRLNKSSALTLAAAAAARRTAATYSGDAMRRLVWLQAIRSVLIATNATLCPISRLYHAFRQTKVAL